MTLHEAYSVQPDQRGHARDDDRIAAHASIRQAEASVGDDERGEGQDPHILLWQANGVCSPARMPRVACHCHACPHASQVKNPRDGECSQVNDGVKSDHVIPLAERWLAWVEQEGSDESA